MYMLKKENRHTLHTVSLSHSHAMEASPYTTPYLEHIHLNTSRSLSGASQQASWRDVTRTLPSRIHTRIASHSCAFTHITPCLLDCLPFSRTPTEKVQFILSYFTPAPPHSLNGTALLACARFERIDGNDRRRRGRAGAVVPAVAYPHYTHTHTHPFSHRPPLPA